MQGILPHRLVCLGHLEAAYALGPGIHDHTDAVVADHSAGIAAPTGEDGQPAAPVVLAQQRVHHVAHARRLDDGQQGMQGSVGVPHREIVVVHLLADIAYGAGKQRSPPQRAVEMLVNLRVEAFHLKGGKALHPYSFQIGRHGVEVPAGNLRLQVGAGAVDALERRSRLDEVRPFRRKAQQHALAGGILHHLEVIVSDDREMAAEARGLAAALIDAVDRITADDLARAGSRTLQHPFPLVTDDGDAQELAVSEAEDGTVAAAGHLPAACRIVRRCCHLRRMVQRHRAVRGQDGEGTVVLSCAAAQPVTGPEAQQLAVFVIIRTYPLALRLPGLRRPESVAVGLGDAGYDIAVDFTPAAEDAGGG